MKKNLLSRAVALLAFVLSSTSLMAQGNYVSYVQINLSNGEKIKIALSEQPLLQLEDDVLLIYSDDIFESMAVSNVEGFALVKEDTESEGRTNETTNIADAKADGVKVAVSGGIVSLSGLKAGVPVQVFSLDGKQVGSAAANKDGNASVDLNALGGKTFVVRAQSASFKIAIK